MIPYPRPLEWNYTCSCGYSWVTFWNRYSQDECPKCGLYNYPVGEEDDKNMKRNEILKQAEKLINGDRNKNYGDAKQNFQDIADLWSVFLGTKVTQEQVAVCMILMKCSRLMKSNHMDGWVDICGYAALGGERNDKTRDR
tara:strand:+ start:8282 stop:8701 length:420 start_codon:yes stop_codon:yes gene_type:complete